jgi:hypothetical protein
MTTIPLTPASFEMLKRAGEAGPRGSLEHKILTAQALAKRGLATLGTWASGAVSVRLTIEGQRRLVTDQAEEMPGAPLITWRDAGHGVHAGYVRGVELFELASAYDTPLSPVWFLRSLALGEVIELPHGAYGTIEGAKVSAEHLFRAFARRLGLAPTPLETWCPRCYLDAEDGSAYTIREDGVRRCEKCDAVLVVPDPPLKES